VSLCQERRRHPRGGDELTEILFSHGLPEQLPQAQPGPVRLLLLLSVSRVPPRLSLLQTVLVHVQPRVRCSLSEPGVGRVGPRFDLLAPDNLVSEGGTFLTGREEMGVDVRIVKSFGGRAVEGTVDRSVLFFFRGGDEC